MEIGIGIGPSFAGQFNNSESEEDIMLSTTVTLTDAQIKALPTTPFELIAAPGTGKMIHFESAEIITDARAGVYTNVDANAIVSIKVGGQPGSNLIENAIQGSVSNCLEDDTDKTVIVLTHTTIPGFTLSEGTPNVVTNRQSVTTIVDYLGDRENTALNLVFNNQAAGNLTGGNAANSMKVVVFYALIDL